MLPLYDLIKLVFDTLGFGLFGWLKYPGMLYYPVMLSVVMLLVLTQYRRQARMEEHLFGAPFSRPLRQTMTSLGFGLLGGIIASILMVTMGIPLSESLGLVYVWPVVLTLMLIRPRFMCFAYGGGVVGLASLMLRVLAQVFPALGGIGLFAGLMAVDISALMALVGLLHLTESFLIYVSGHINAGPVIIQNPRGELVGGFMLQRFWPLPMAALFAEIVLESGIADGGIGMPDWWPLLQPAAQPGPGMIVLFSLLPIVAALGYSDLAVSTSPRQKSRISARNLSVYSLALLALSILAGQWRFLELLPVLFAPLGHEFLIQAGNHREWAGRPLLAPSPRGIKLLAVLPGSPAQEKGLTTGWIIAKVNGLDVDNSRQLAHALNLFPGLADLDVISPEGNPSTIQLHQRQGTLGLIPVPDGSRTGAFLNLANKGFLARQWDKWTKKKSDA